MSEVSVGGSQKAANTQCDALFRVQASSYIIGQHGGGVALEVERLARTGKAELSPQSRGLLSV